jgi:peptidyl-prolyl cis-trans isomerase D
MFQFFRRQDAAVRWFLGGLLVLICLTMVITLIPGATGTSDASTDVTVLGKVCGNSITSAEVMQQFQQMSQGQRLPAGFLSIYAPTILKNMTDEKAMNCEAHRVGLDVTSDEVATRLRAIPGLFPGGVFIGADRYREIIETKANLPVETFEENIRQEILRGKLVHLVTDAISVGDTETDAEYHRQNDKVKVDYVLLDAPKFEAEVKMDEADMKAFFDRTRENFRIPERRKLKIAVLDMNKIREATDVTPDDLHEAYERNKGRYRVDERVQVSHILEKTQDKTPDQVKEAEKKANDLLARARKGEDFAELAKANSEDVDSAKNGGSVGWLKRGQLVPDVEKIVWSMQPGQISDVIKTAYGFDIMKLTAHEPAHQRTLQEVQVELLQAVKAEKVERAEQRASDQLDAALRKDPKSVDALASQLKMILLEDPGHERGAAFVGLGPSQPADEAVLALKPGEMTGMITVGKQEAVFQLVEIQPARLPEMAEVHDRVVKDYKTAKSIEILAARSKEFGERLKALGDLKKAAKEKNYEVKSSAALAVTGNLEGFGTTPEFPGGAFKLKVGDVAGPVMGRGNLFYQLVELNVASPEETAKNRETTRQTLSEEKRNSYLKIYMAQLRERLQKEGKITTNEAAMKRLTASVAQ